jgi:hypothetical protein
MEAEGGAPAVGEDELGGPLAPLGGVFRITEGEGRCGGPEGEREEPVDPGLDVTLPDGIPGGQPCSVVNDSGDERCRCGRATELSRHLRALTRQVLFGE